MTTTNTIQFESRNGSWNDYSMYNAMPTEQLIESRDALVKEVARSNRTQETNPLRYFRAYTRLLAIRLKLAEITQDEYTRLYDAENRRRLQILTSEHMGAIK